MGVTVDCDLAFPLIELYQFIPVEITPRIRYRFPSRCRSNVPRRDRVHDGILACGNSSLFEHRDHFVRPPQVFFEPPVLNADDDPALDRDVALPLLDHGAAYEVAVIEVNEVPVHKSGLPDGDGNVICPVAFVVEVDDVALTRP